MAVGAATTLDAAVFELGTALSALHDITSQPGGSQHLLSHLGWLPPSTGTIDLASLDVSDMLKKLADLRAVAPANRDDISVMAPLYGALAAATTQFAVAVTTFASSLKSTLSQAYLTATAIEKDFPKRLIDLLVVEHVLQRAPRAASVLSTLGIFRLEEHQAVPPDFKSEHIRREVDYERLSTLFSNPLHVLEQVYGWGTSLFDGAALVDAIALAIEGLGGVATLGSLPKGVEEALVGQAVPSAASPLRQAVVTLDPATALADMQLGLAIQAVRPTAAGSGLSLVPAVAAGTAVSFKLSDTLTLEIDAGIASETVVVTFRAGSGPTVQQLSGGSITALGSGHFGLSVKRSASQGARLRLVRLPADIVLDCTQLSVRGGVDVDSGAADGFAEAGIGGARLLVPPPRGDGFLAKLLPKDGLKQAFGITLGWSHSRGIYLRAEGGGPGRLELVLRLHKELGPFTLDVLELSIDPKASGLHVEVALTGRAQLGPVAASVTRIGAKADLAFPSDGKGNLGFVDLQPGFRPPDGAGLKVGAGPVSGGGFLFFDTKNEQYAGAMQLHFGAIGLTAVGLLATRLPDGSPGFSLLVIITAEFPPIQLGFGFVLTGAGGLLGVNRTIVTDVLRAGIKNKTLESILFPKDVVANAPKVISDLGAVFPPAPGQFVIGPMAKLGWGTPTILTLELGIVLELPSPIRLVLIGRLSTVLPEPKAPEVVINMDVLGIVEFDRQQASLDATLVDSRLTEFVLTGDMAMRAGWGANPAFALAAGGFNPSFQPPPNFPALDRLAITLASGNNPRLRLESYFALTSNTVQFGARAEVYAALDTKLLGVFSAEAFLGFDALFHFPFEVAIDIAGAAAVKHDGQPILVATLELHLTGPAPWHAWGKAAVNFLGRHEIPLDITIGPTADPQPLPTSNPGKDLADALADPANWTAQMPLGGEALVSLREFEPPPKKVVAHPLGDLTVRQRVVPLNVEIQRYGDTQPAPPRRFEITTVKLDNAPLTLAPGDLKELFAPAQFFELSDAEKISRPSFEPMTAGVRIGTAAVKFGAAVPKTFDYQNVVVDVDPQTRRKTAQPPTSYSIATGTLEALAGLGAAGEAQLDGARRYSGESQGIAVDERAYVLVGTSDLAEAHTATLMDTRRLSFTEAELLRRDHERRNPDDAGVFQVVPAHEVAR